MCWCGPLLCHTFSWLKMFIISFSLHFTVVFLIQLPHKFHPSEIFNRSNFSKYKMPIKTPLKTTPNQFFKGVASGLQQLSFFNSMFVLVGRYCALLFLGLIFS